MAIQVIPIGSAPNAGDGIPFRDMVIITNANFQYLLKPVRWDVNGAAVSGSVRQDVSGNLGIFAGAVNAVDGAQLQGLSINKANGFIGVGTTSPAARFHVRPATNVNIEFGSLSSSFRFEVLNDARSSYIPLRIQAGNIELNPSSGNVGIGGSAGTHKLAVTGSAAGGILSAVPANATAVEIFNTSVSKSFAFFPITNGSDSDLGVYANSGTPGTRVTIQGASGNVGIGTTTPTYGKLIVNGAITTISDNNSLINFVNLAQTVRQAYIQHDGANLNVNNQLAGNLTLFTNNLGRLTINSAGSVFAGGDNTQNFGGPSNRWAVIYAGTGTINTSDAREKTPIRAFSVEEIAAARDLVAEIGVYQWLASVEEKGEDAARLHIGMTVQRAIEIMEGHGLDPWRYGFICRDEITRKVKVLRTETKQKTEPDPQKDIVIEIIDGVPTQVQRDRPDNPVFELAQVIGEDGKPAIRRVQATEDAFETVTAIELHDGLPVQVSRKHVVKKPLFDMIAVLDEAGQPVTRIEDFIGESGFPEERAVPVLHPVPVMIDEPIMHAVPVMEDREIEVEIDEPAGDRLGFRYDQLALFILAGMQQGA